MNRIEEIVRNTRGSSYVVALRALEELREQRAALWRENRTLRRRWTLAFYAGLVLGGGIGLWIPRLLGAQ